MADCLKCKVKSYYQAVESRDLDEAMSYLADDFRLRFEGSDMVLDPKGMRRAMEWDAGAAGQASCEDLQWEGSTVTGVVTESNRFLELIGIESLAAHMTFHFDGDERVREQIYRPLSGQPDIAAAMAPALAWARTHRKAELGEIYPDEQMVYSGEMARRWIALLEDWRRATSETVHASLP